MDKKLLWDTHGNGEQLFAIRTVNIASGPQKGLGIIELENGSGLALDILPDNGLDIGKVRYKGIPMAWISKNGYTKPNSGENFRDYFSGGILYTCGLSNVGPACNEGGYEHALHGRFHKLGASNICTDIVDDRFIVSGWITESTQYGVHMAVKRTIEVPLFANRIKVTDTIENRSASNADLMLLYHMNFSYPLVSENTELILPPDTASRARDAESKKGFADRYRFSKPVAGCPEQVFYHDVPKPMACIQNKALGVAVHLNWSKDTLPKLIEWKSMGTGEYALGVEPGNCLVDGKLTHKQRGEILQLQGYASIDCRVEIAFEDMA